jgi:hypothetical protein
MPVLDLSTEMQMTAVVLRGMSVDQLSIQALLTSAAVPSVQSSSNESIADPNWTKEALFGLFSVLLVVLLPCIGLLFKVWLARRRGAELWRRNLNSTCTDLTPSS